MDSMNSDNISAASGHFINGRYLVRRGGAWVDPVVETMPDAQRVRVRPDSQEYVQLMTRYPQVLLLSGTLPIQLALGETIYELFA